MAAHVGLGLALEIEHQLEVYVEDARVVLRTLHVTAHPEKAIGGAAKHGKSGC